ncbi:hypothetical protein GQ44DRAFT_20652 [Phaeosphaeriaceae sp. PMI808]|nr:hypothetical protein GQ44DRAFT_20652 [Phaeosphaeriaceae sp. PMI808]
MWALCLATIRLFLDEKKGGALIRGLEREFGSLQSSTADIPIFHQRKAFYSIYSMAVNDIYSAAHLRNGDNHVVHGPDPLTFPTLERLPTEEELVSLPVNATFKILSEDGSHTANVQANGDAYREQGQKQLATNGTGPVPRGLPNKVDLEPLAIIGMAFQFPDEATDEETFWNMLAEKRCASREYPKERLNIDSFDSANTNKPCSSISFLI